MESSCNDPNKGIDSSVGGLVWVRRRNGSWWPGRIMSPDELPENCVPMPRLGTPVKLLGREDASVDWYNLDKSKRIKAFRCGEYDECIEKAKAASAHLSKKAVKYARREDAIIQALELESARHGKEDPDFSAGPGIHDEESHHVDQSPSSFHTTGESDDADGDLSVSEVSDLSCSSTRNEDCMESALELSQSGASIEESDLVDSSKEGSRRWRTPNDSEDDGTEGVKRMRGLQDLGMGVTSSLKRKRSQITPVHEFLKRKNRRRTLSKVLECTPVVPVTTSAFSAPDGSSVSGASDNKVLGLESNESKEKSLVLINNNSDSTGISCENGTSLEVFKNASASLNIKQEEHKISIMPEVLENDSLERLYDVPLAAEEKQSAGTQSSQISHVGTLCLGNDEHGSGSTILGTADVHNISQMIEKSTSEWRLKGKRNSRSRKTGGDDETDTAINRNSFLIGMGQNANPNRVGGSLMLECHNHHVKSRPISEIQLEESRGWNWNARTDFSAGGSTSELPVPVRSLPYRQSRFMVNPKYDSSEFSLRHHIAVSGLYDVPVEVQASYRPQRVPYISLMSKLNGQPIVGHPLAVEKLNDGFCDNLIKIAACNGSNSEFDHNLSEAASASQVVDTVNGRRSRGRSLRKYVSIQSSTNSSTKPTKSRRNALFSKKTRKLSSLNGTGKNRDMKPIVEKLDGPSIACVPLTVVFSRINAAMNSSIRHTPRLTATDVV